MEAMVFEIAEWSGGLSTQPPPLLSQKVSVPKGLAREGLRHFSDMKFSVLYDKIAFRLLKSALDLFYI